MKAIRTLIKLQFKAGFSTDKSSSVPKAVKLFMYSVVLLAVLFALVVVYGMVTRHFTQTLDGVDGEFTLSKQYLTFTVLGFHALQTVFIIPILLKNLDINNERETLLRLPVTRMQIFISKIAVSFLYELIFAAVIMTPIFISFGIFTSAGVSYWLMIPFAVLFLPCLPFFISSLLLYPIMLVLRFLKSHSVLTFLAYLSVIGFMFYVYMQVLTNVAMVIIYSKGMKALLEGSAANIISTAKIFVFQNLFSSVFTGPAWQRVLYLLLCGVIGLIFVCASIFILNKIFVNTFKAENRKGFTLRKVKESRRRPAILSITIRELKNIFRSPNYSFQFFMVIILIPFFVFFCTNIASYATLLTFREAGQLASSLEYAQVMIFGIALFVTSMMVPLANSFAATNISREAGNIYHTKVIPVSYRKQLMIKFFVCLVPTLISLLISSLLLLIPMHYAQLVTANPTLKIGEAMLLFLISGLLSTGFISIGTLMDLKRPLCSAIGNAAGGELANSTRQVNVVILIGVLLGALIGLSVIFEDKITAVISIDLKIIYTVIAAIIAVAGFSMLYFTGTNKYRRLEQ